MVGCAASGNCRRSGKRIAGVKQGVLQIGVASSALLSELAAFHKQSLLDKLQSDHPHLQVRDIRFRLRGEISPS